MSYPREILLEGQREVIKSGKQRLADLEEEIRHLRFRLKREEQRYVRLRDEDWALPIDESHWWFKEE